MDVSSGQKEKKVINGFSHWEREKQPWISGNWTGTIIYPVVLPGVFTAGQWYALIEHKQNMGIRYHTVIMMDQEKMWAVCYYIECRQKPWKSFEPHKWHFPLLVGTWITAVFFFFFNPSELWHHSPITFWIRFIKIPVVRLSPLSRSIQCRAKPCFLESSPEIPHISPTPKSFLISDYCDSS